jgi:hypothetical protein
VLDEPGGLGPAVREILPVADADQHRPPFETRHQELQHALAFPVGQKDVFQHQQQGAEPQPVTDQPLQGFNDVPAPHRRAEGQPGRFGVAALQQFTQGGSVLSRRPRLRCFEGDQCARKIGDDSVRVGARIAAGAGGADPEAFGHGAGAPFLDQPRLADAGFPPQAHDVNRAALGRTGQAAE